MPHYDRPAVNRGVPDIKTELAATEEDAINAATTLRETEVEAAQAKNGERVESVLAHSDNRGDLGRHNNDTL